MIDITTVSSALNRMMSILEKQDERLSNVESQLQDQKQIEEKPRYKKPYNPWFAKMNPKYQLLEDYFDITRGELYKNILEEMENIYNIDTNQIQADYCYENNITSCYPLEPYEFKQKYRQMIEGIVNDNLIKYGIASEDDPITSTRHITIFDTPVSDKREQLI
uniref:Polymerase cofactor VP35-coil, VIRAL PROTEIN n=1 Tax=Siphoviridae sp. ctr2f5 TaxID=2825684 RepID=A0A8S5QET6_9CAUD|nr:MAG TPA: polymerase cofactor VP35-coil, VIRAL PROTEIN [Siphoviridae sp. ctr2f5]